MKYSPTPRKEIDRKEEKKTNFRKNLPSAQFFSSPHKTLLIILPSVTSIEKKIKYISIALTDPIPRPIARKKIPLVRREKKRAAKRKLDS